MYSARLLTKLNRRRLTSASQTITSISLRTDPSASEPHEPVGEIERVRTLGGAPVVITPPECCGELAGGLRVLDRQLAAGGCQQVVRELAASSFQIGELRRTFERINIGAENRHLESLRRRFLVSFAWSIIPVMEQNKPLSRAFTLCAASHPCETGISSI
jgi:hypothetical protein